jgi:hypothetical protein
MSQGAAAERFMAQPVYPESRGIVRVGKARSLVNGTCGSFTVSPPLSRSRLVIPDFKETRRGAVFQKREERLYPLDPSVISHGNISSTVRGRECLSRIEGP